MSYDLVVREGARPADKAIAGEHFRRLYDRYIGTDDHVPPSPHISEYVAGLVGLQNGFSGCELGLVGWSARSAILVDQPSDNLSAFDPNCG